MSAIAGIYHLDNRPVDRGDLERMGERLAHRGPDGSGAWVQGAVGLGRRLLRVTPESQAEEPTPAGGDGRLVLTADARLDNRDDLRRALDIADPDITDSGLILRAYEAWGERCPERLTGDFAFAVWDGAQRSLFCARDYLGARPLYYHRTDRTFAFASEIKGLLALPGVPRRINDVKVADYLAPYFEGKSGTFYRGIFRLPPGHTLTVGPEGVRLRRYWSLDNIREISGWSDDDYADAFRALFTEAVRARLRSTGPVGSMLSGGLDSSSVVCVARRLLDDEGDAPLHTFSATFDEVPECDERPYMEAVLARGGFAPHFVQADRMSPLGQARDILREQDEPFFLPDQYIQRAIYRTAADHGVRVVLDGVDGDAAVSHGLPYLAELLRAGRWMALARETAALARGTGSSLWKILRHDALGPFVPEAAWQARRVLSRRPGPVWGYDATIREDFARRTGLLHRVRMQRRDLARPAPTVREGHRRQIDAGLVTVMMEVLDRSAAAFAVEPRHPFFDRRVVEFCFALPPDQRIRQGWTRAVVRRAMTGVLPEEIRRRNSKTDRNHNLIRGLLTADRACLDDLFLRDPRVLEPYVNVDRLREAYYRFTAQPRIEDLLTVWKTATLALWLRQAGLRP